MTPKEKKIIRATRRKLISALDFAKQIADDHSDWTWKECLKRGFSAYFTEREVENLVHSNLVVLPGGNIKKVA